MRSNWNWAQRTIGTERRARATGRKRPLLSLLHLLSSPHLASPSLASKGTTERGSRWKSQRSWQANETDARLVRPSVGRSASKQATLLRVHLSVFLSFFLCFGPFVRPSVRLFVSFPFCNHSYPRWESVVRGRQWRAGIFIYSHRNTQLHKGTLHTNHEQAHIQLTDRGSW